jgi:TM2 domain-containing membrane protein YozV
MNCYLHTDIPAIAFCRACGRALCASCQRPASGTVFCAEHVPGSTAYGGAADPYSTPAGGPNPYTQPGPPPPPTTVQTSPGLAFLLGLIPGVGAIYNGQYMKGLVHAVLFGFFMSFANSADHTAGEPVLALLVAAFYFYMPFEAYHTARKRQLGIAVDEWSSLLSQSRLTSARTPIGPIVLILLGVFFLLDSLHLISFQAIGRFWPVILIAAGAAMLYSRLGSTQGSAHYSDNVTHYPGDPNRP